MEDPNHKTSLRWDSFATWCHIMSETPFSPYFIYLFSISFQETTLPICVSWTPIMNLTLLGITGHILMGLGKVNLTIKEGGKCWRLRNMYKLRNDTCKENKAVCN